MREYHPVFLKKLFFVDYKVGMGEKCKLKMVKGKWNLIFFHYVRKNVSEYLF